MSKPVGEIAHTNKVKTDEEGYLLNLGHQLDL